EALRARLPSRPWRLLLHGAGRGPWNMAVDAALLEVAAAGGAPTLRFYTWDPPAVSLGRFQDPGRGIDWAACRDWGWGVVRRPTGGRAVLHHRELTYSLTLPPDVLAGAPLRASCSVFRSGLLHALEACLGISLSETCRDPTIEGGQPAGSGGRVSLGAQGSRMHGGRLQRHAG